ncbi:MAG: hypothetical protein CR988_08350 [Treponema sp.]|nr:MAG: hypothetical protein CR988_08350 [Treponema sp.]
MILYYGIKEKPLKTKNINTVWCSSCSKRGFISFSMFSKYFHIFWIPIFPVFRWGYSECSYCNNRLEPKVMPEDLKEEYKKFKKEAKFKIWQFSGVIAVVLLFLFFYLRVVLK